MLHHLSLPVSNLSNSAALYDNALEALGYVCVVFGDHYRGYGTEQGKDKLLLVEQTGVTPGKGFHLAFTAPSRAAVDAFYATALECGAKDNGAPGLRPDYGEKYYAAFVIDLDGHHLEAVINKSTE